MNATVAEQPLAPAIDLAGYLESAFRDFRQGRLDEATASCREILSHHPDQADAWYLLGVIAARAGQIEKSVECHEKAVALRRAYARYREGLGRAYRSAKRLDAAAGSLEQAIRLEPRLATAHLELGLTELDRGHAKPGMRHYRRAFGLLFGALAKGLWLRTLYVTAAPLLGLARWLTTRRCTLGAALDIEKGRLCTWHGEHEKAGKHFQSALRRAPDCVPAMAALGRQMLFLENYPGAAETLARAVELCPGDADTLASSAMATFRMGRYDDAADMAQKALAGRPKSVQGRLALGSTRVQQNRPEEAMGEFEEILRHDRRNVHALLGKARTLQTLGRADEAQQALDRALAIDPTDARTYRLLTSNRRLKPDDPTFRRLQALTEIDRLPARQRSLLNFAVATVHSQSGDPDAAFLHYQRANDLKDVVFCAEACEAEFEQLMRSYDTAFFERTAGWGSDSRLPVLIVGMPRSGTTLVEQIIASHPRTFGAGELEAFSQLAADLPATLNSARSHPDCVEDLDRASVETLSGQHLAYLGTLSKDAERITDKMPPNFLRLGLIHCLFPRAPIIHCQRDPMDTCLSLYMQALNFLGHYPYAYNLTNLGRYYRLYERLMEHWREALPAPVLEVKYEDMIADHETQIRRIIEFCDLPWDDRCLAFHTTERTVLTASHDQVRRPIYNSAVQRWKKYEKHLEPLLAALGSPD